MTVLVLQSHDKGVVTTWCEFRTLGDDRVLSFAIDNCPATAIRGMWADQQDERMVMAFTNGEMPVSGVITGFNVQPKSELRQTYSVVGNIKLNK